MALHGLWDLLPHQPICVPQVATGSSRFSGCVRRLRLDGRHLGAPTRVMGVTPCFSGALEKGLFFADSGGVVTLGL